MPVFYSFYCSFLLSKIFHAPALTTTRTYTPIDTHTHTHTRKKYTHTESRSRAAGYLLPFPYAISPTVWNWNVYSQIVIVFSLCCRLLLSAEKKRVACYIIYWIMCYLLIDPLRYLCDKYEYLIVNTDKFNKSLYVL